MHNNIFYLSHAVTVNDPAVDVQLGIHLVLIVNVPVPLVPFVAVTEIVAVVTLTLVKVTVNDCILDVAMNVNP